MVTRASWDDRVIAEAVLPGLVARGVIGVAALGNAVADGVGHTRSTQCYRRVDVRLCDALAPTWRVRDASCWMRETASRESRLSTSGMDNR